MTRISRIKLTTKELGISRGDKPSQIFDNLFATTWRITPEEMAYINDNADDEQLELLTHCEDFGGKRLAIQLRNRMVSNYLVEKTLSLHNLLYELGKSIV